MKPDNVITSYINELVTSFPTIIGVWLFGSRANQSFRDDSDWDLLVFADATVLDGLRKCHQFHRANIDLLIVYDGDAFVSPWGNKPKKGNLKEWKWRICNNLNALYTETKWIQSERLSEEFNCEMGDFKRRRRKAVKVWPLLQHPTMR